MDLGDGWWRDDMGIAVVFWGGGFGVEDVRVLRTRRCAQDWCASCVGNVK